MKNFRLTVQYDGKRYSGWQRQGNTDKTVQGKIEQILSRMTGHAVEINGAGRTDAGVHARAQVANGKMNTDKTAAENTQNSTSRNTASILPLELSIFLIRYLSITVSSGIIFSAKIS